MNIELSIEEARKLYPTASKETKDFLEKKFGKERFTEHEMTQEKFEKKKHEIQSKQQNQSMIDCIQEFRESGLLWLVNLFLHVFGWALTVETDGSTTSLYPKRVAYRGFTEERNTKGYIQVSKWMAEHCGELLEESKS